MNKEMENTALRIGNHYADNIELLASYSHTGTVLRYIKDEHLRIGVEISDAGDVCNVYVVIFDQDDMTVTIHASEAMLMSYYEGNVVGGFVLPDDVASVVRDWGEHVWKNREFL